MKLTPSVNTVPAQMANSTQSLFDGTFHTGLQPRHIHPITANGNTHHNSTGQNVTASARLSNSVPAATHTQLISPATIADSRQSQRFRRSKNTPTKNKNGKMPRARMLGSS